jgi:hypothetical protein
VLRLSTKHVARLGSFETSVDKLQVQAISKGASLFANPRSSPRHAGFL